jgi:hypothetical protein
LDIVFMIVVSVLYFYQIFVKTAKDDWSRFRSDSLATLARYLHFGAMISIFAEIIFDIEWMPWIALYSMLGVTLCLKPKKTESEARKKVLIILLLIFAFNMFRIPTHPNSFQDYISSKETYQCIQSFECVKMTSVVTPDDLLETRVEMLSVEGYSFDTYFLFAKGSMKLANEDGVTEKMKGVNIAGFWLEY